MSYAVRHDGLGFRAVNGLDDVTEGEFYSESVPAPSVEAIRSTKREAIKAERERRKAGGFQVDGLWYHSDQESLIRYLGLVQLGQNIPLRDWKTMDGTLIAMTPTLAAEIFAAAVAHDGAVFDAAQVHLAALSASLDLENYDFSAGWPAIFV